MTLGFSTHIKGKQTYFIEKILECFDMQIIHDYSLEYFDKFKWHLVGTTEISKKHTIREDKKDRWKVGSDIHFVINNRTKKRFQFAPILKVQSIQKIEMVSRGIKGERQINVYVDNKNIGCGKDLEEFAKNDGFDTLDEFYDYFKDGFKGKLIHWTSLTY